MTHKSFVMLAVMLCLSACAAPSLTSPISPTTAAATVQPSATLVENTATPQSTIVPTETPPATTTMEPSLTITPLAEGRIVIKKTAGLPVTGSLYGHGETAVVLASQGGTSESEWNTFAKYLAKNGFTALAVSSPEGQGDTVVLVGQAIDFLRQNGYHRIICAGASNGASGCAFNVEQPDLTGLLLITYHGAANLSKVSLPKLFIAGETADPWRATTETGFKTAGEPKTLIIVPQTPGTGPSILSVNEDIQKQVLDFLKKCNGL